MITMSLTPHQSLGQRRRKQFRQWGSFSYVGLAVAAPFFAASLTPPLKSSRVSLLFRAQHNSTRKSLASPHAIGESPLQQAQLFHRYQSTVLARFFEQAVVLCPKLCVTSVGKSCLGSAHGLRQAMMRHRLIIADHAAHTFVDTLCICVPDANCHVTKDLGFATTPSQRQNYSTPAVRCDNNHCCWAAAQLF